MINKQETLDITNIVYIYIYINNNNNPYLLSHLHILFNRLLLFF